MMKKVFLKKLTLFSLIFFLFFGSSLSSNFGPNRDDGQNQRLLAATEKMDVAKPGMTIFIGVIPPEKGEEAPLPKLDIPQEKEPRPPLRPEDRARLKKRLSELEREKNILTGDFYGLNQYGYRYAMVFDRLGYIRFRLHQVDTEIAEIKKKLSSGF